MTRTGTQIFWCLHQGTGDMAGDNTGNKEGLAFLELTIWETVGGETPNYAMTSKGWVIQRSKGNVSQGPKRNEEAGESLWEGAGVGWAWHGE